MIETMIRTGTSNLTEYGSWGDWRGQKVWVHSIDPPCDTHNLGVMHHYDDEGNHYCPTGFLWCPTCGGVADEPDPPTCTLVGQKPAGREEP